RAATWCPPARCCCAETDTHDRGALHAPFRRPGLDPVLGSGPAARAALPALHRLRRMALPARPDVRALLLLREHVGAGQRPGPPGLVGDVPSARPAGVEGAHALHRRAGGVRGGRANDGEPRRCRAGRAAHGHGHGGRLRPLARRRPRATVAARRLSRWGLLLAAALATILRAPVYFTAPSFWAEEGTLYFVVAWERPVHEALIYRPAGYLLLWANFGTVLAARLVRGGLLSLVHAPQVTVLVALVAQLLPVAVIAWSRAPFWDGGV